MKKTFTVNPGHTVVVNDPQVKGARYLKAGERWEFEDDAETACYVASGALAPVEPPAEPEATEA